MGRVLCTVVAALGDGAVVSELNQDDTGGRVDVAVVVLGRDNSMWYSILGKQKRVIRHSSVVLCRSEDNSDTPINVAIGAVDGGR